MKSLIVGLFLVTLAIVTFCLFKALQSDKKHKKYLIYMFFSVIIDLAANLMLFFPENELYCNVVNAVYFISVDFGVFYLMCFCFDYIKNKIKGDRFIFVSKILFVLDAAFILSNIFFAS